MKKLLSVILILLLSLSLVACDLSNIENETTDNIQNNSHISNETPSQTTEGKNDGLIDSEFKAAMDSYEEFFDEYVEIMKKYKENPSDMSILADYATYMGQYADMMQKFEKWENEDLNDAEMAYYLEVQTRISKKLLEAA